MPKPHGRKKGLKTTVRRPRLAPVDLWCDLPTDCLTHILGFLCFIPPPTPSPATAASLASLSHLGATLQTLGRVCRAWQCSIKSTQDDWLFGRMFCAKFHLVKATCCKALPPSLPDAHQATVRCTCPTPLSQHNWGALLRSRLMALKALGALCKREAIQRMQRLSVKSFSSVGLKKKTNVVCDVCTCSAVLKAKDLAMHMRVHHKLTVLRRAKQLQGGK